jgi:hypothetical protein
MNFNLAKPAYRTQRPAQSEKYTVRGKSASSYEYNFALALDKYNMDYLFQVDYWGGRSMRGGLVLDFLVFTQPLYTPVWINGEYWHSGNQRQEDFLQQALLEMFEQLAQVKIYWGQDVETFEQAQATVRRDFNV